MFKIKLVTRAALIRLTILFLILGTLGAWGVERMIGMPGKSYHGPLPPLSEREMGLRDALTRDVQKLAGEIGDRNLSRYQGLTASVEFLTASLAAAGYEVRTQSFAVRGKTCSNLEVEIPGGQQPKEIVVVGGHYDSVEECPGANDNGTGAAAVLALAQAFAGKKPNRTLRFVEFVNEEPPYFQTPEMGSVVYAKRCRQRGEKIVAMLSLETIGYYSDREKSQKYPFPFNLFYPSTGNFIGVVGNPASRELTCSIVGLFRQHVQFPSEGVAAPESIAGIGWSDHWAFWQEGYPAVMVTDTAPFRYPHYHEREDTPDKIDYERTARVVSGLEKVIAELAGVAEK